MNSKSKKKCVGGKERYRILENTLFNGNTGSSEEICIYFSFMLMESLLTRIMR